MVVTGFSGSRRHAILAAALLCLLPFTAFSACWEIAMSDQTVTATDLWQIRNRVSGEATLLGDTGGERRAISIERVKAFTVGDGPESSGLSGNRSAVEIEIQLIDDQTVALVSEMTLYYIVDDKRHAVRLGDVVSVNRCADESTAVPPPPEATKSKPSAPMLVMKNGDILYGEVAADQLLWQTSYASVGFKPAEIRVITAGCEAPSTGILETLAGDQLYGSFVDTSISFHLTTGQSMDIPTDQVEMIDFAGTQAADRMTIKRCNNGH